MQTFFPTKISLGTHLVFLRKYELAIIKQIQAFIGEWLEKKLEQIEKIM